MIDRLHLIGVSLGDGGLQGQRYVLHMIISLVSCTVGSKMLYLFDRNYPMRRK